MAGESRVTSIIEYSELEGDGTRVTGFITYSEMSGMALYITSVLVYEELEVIAGEGYAVGIGRDIPEGFLRRLNPQPHTEGPKITRRDYAGAEDPNALDNAEYIDFEYSGLASAAMYGDILQTWGLDDASERIVTIWAKGKFYEWQRYNGVALQPQIKKTAQWSNYFPRNITIRVIALEPIE